MKRRPDRRTPSTPPLAADPRRAHGRTPRTAKAEPRREDLTRAKAIRALAQMRQGASMSQACRLERIKPQTLRRVVGSAVRQDKPGGRFRAVAADRLRRELHVLTAKGPVPVEVTGLAAARKLSAYNNAVAHFNRTGDRSKLRPFEGKTLPIAAGGRMPFLTDPEVLMQLASADALRLDSLYAAVVGRS